MINYPFAAQLRDPVKVLARAEDYFFPYQGARSPCGTTTGEVDAKKNHNRDSCGCRRRRPDGLFRHDTRRLTDLRRLTATLATRLARHTNHRAR
jgi:hypothetical protein